MQSTRRRLSCPRGHLFPCSSCPSLFPLFIPFEIFVSGAPRRSFSTPPLGLEIDLSHPVYTVWGSNTGVGKTLVSAGLAASVLCPASRPPFPSTFLYVKPIQTGFPDDSDSRFVFRKSCDFFLHRRPKTSLFASNQTVRSSVAAAKKLPDLSNDERPGNDNGLRQLYSFDERRLCGADSPMDGFELVCKTLYGWKEAVSPHLAAEKEGGVVSDEELVHSLQKCLQLHSVEGDFGSEARMWSVIETAGGVASPGPSGSLQCDIYRAFRLPAILVGDGRLGGISGTISAYESLKLRGYDIAAVILEDHGWASRTYFSDNGSTAIEIALKMAFRKYSVDHGILSRLTDLKPHMDNIDFKVLALSGSYHGDTLGAMEAQAPSPFTGFLQQPWYLVIQGAGGMQMIDPLFQRVLVNECRKRGIPVIYDEVFTGFWRLGVESAAELLGCSPDIACYAKLMTGGVIPLAATLATEAVYNAFTGDSKLMALLHGHSYSAHALGCTAAVKAIQWFKESQTNPNIIPQKMLLKELWNSKLVYQLSTKMAVKRVIALGTLCAVELNSESNYSGYASLCSTFLIGELRRNGIYMRPLGNVIYLMCGPCTSPQVCHQVLEKVYERIHGSDTC
ncbi:unnamed protein product [Victoria cruziana]